MPALATISDKKDTDISGNAEILDSPHIVIAQVGGGEPKKSNTRKYVILAVAIILAALIILAAILIGWHFFSLSAQKELIQYSLKFNQQTKQDVTSDPNTNIVKYEIQNAGQKTWVVDDFNRDIQVVKIQTSSQTNCYVSALNRTRSQNPSQITGPDTKEVSNSSTLTYVTSGTPISDISFLAKAASDLCSGISTYWLYPKCSSDGSYGNPPPGPYSTSTLLPQTSRGSPVDQSTQNPVDHSPWYIYWSYPYNANTTVFCVTGCCKTVCACSINYYWYLSRGSLYCTWVATSCPTLGVVENPVNQYCTDGPTGLTCPNTSPATLPNC